MCLLPSESGITIRAVAGEPNEPRVRDAAAGRVLLAGCCPLCRMTLLIHGDAMCCPCCGCRWRATINSIQLLSCSLHPIRACRHWVTTCEAADRVLKATTQAACSSRTLELEGLFSAVIAASGGA